MQELLSKCMRNSLCYQEFLILSVNEIMLMVRIISEKNSKENSESNWEYPKGCVNLQIDVR